jgi:hypothetical protein
MTPKLGQNGHFWLKNDTKMAENGQEMAENRIKLIRKWSKMALKKKVICIRRGKGSIRAKKCQNRPK